MEFLMNVNMKILKGRPILILLLIGYTRLSGLPEGTTSVLGGGSSSVMGSEMTIQAPDGSVFEHQSFNLAPAETVRFVQPSANARTLNRITGSIPSQIDGRIIANGQVYLFNPSGVIFGEGSVVEANKLHAVAGSLSNTDFVTGLENYNGLAGSVENEGIIRAKEVVLGGQSVRNKGSIIAKDGVVVIAAGAGLQLSTMDGSLTVNLTSFNEGQVGSASDLSGQALLESGIIEATKVFLHGNQVVNKGTIKGDQITVEKFSSFDSSAGSLETDQLLMNGNMENSTLGSVDLSSKNNQISKVSGSGSFDQVSIRTNTSLKLVAPIENSVTGNNDELVIRNLDLRSDEGDLIIDLNFAPIFSSQTNSLLLAAKENLLFSYQGTGGTEQTIGIAEAFTLDPLTILNQPDNVGLLLSGDALGQLLDFQQTLKLNFESGNFRMLLYGQNISTALFSKILDKPDDLYYLDAAKLSMDDLTHNLSASSMITLSNENPNFGGFEFGDRASFNLNEGVSQDDIAPDSPSFSTPVVDLPSIDITNPGFTPVDLSQPYLSNSGNTLSLEQLALAMKYGLVGGNSYFLRAKQGLTEEELLLLDYSNLGGTSSSFGGSYDVVSSSSSSGGETTASDSDAGSSEEGESESASEDSGGSGQAQSKNSAMAMAQARALGALPFAPISRPILSPQASFILEEALSDEIEQNLQNYLSR
jgi:filamentous hemagglutinin family protein